MGNLGTTFGGQTFGEVDYVNSGIAVIASATAISPIGDMVRITGNTTIATINLPCPGFVGVLQLYNTDASTGTWSTGGNIALGGTFTRYKVFGFIYDASVSKWYPNSIV
jgi:hypothetical protein